MARSRDAAWRSHRASLRTGCRRSSRPLRSPAHGGLRLRRRGPWRENRTCGAGPSAAPRGWPPMNRQRERNRAGCWGCGRENPAAPPGSSRAAVRRSPTATWIAPPAPADSARPGPSLSPARSPSRSCCARPVPARRPSAPPCARLRGAEIAACRIPTGRGPQAVLRPRRDSFAVAVCRSFLFPCRLVEDPELLELLADFRLKAAVHRPIPLHFWHAFRQVALARRIGIHLVVRVSIALAIAEVLHEPRRRVANVQGHGTRSILGDKTAGRIIGFVNGVGFCPHSEVKDGFGKREFSLRAA